MRTVPPIDQASVELETGPLAAPFSCVPRLSPVSYSFLGCMLAAVAYKGHTHMIIGTDTAMINISSGNPMRQ